MFLPFILYADTFLSISIIVAFLGRAYKTVYYAIREAEVEISPSLGAVSTADLETNAGR